MSRRPTAKELSVRGFRRKKGKFPNSVTWFHNRGSLTGPEPNLTIYELGGPGYALRVNISLPKFANGQNITLLRGDEIDLWLERLSKYVFETSGIEFDSFSALVARIDYATNFSIPSLAADRFLNRLRHIKIPWMPYNAQLSTDRCIYLGNKSRIYRVYDKSHESNEIARENIIVRAEYSFRNEKAVIRYSERLGVTEHRAHFMKCSRTRKGAIDQMFHDLRLGSFVAKTDSSFKGLLISTDGDVDRARRCSSFVAAYEHLGPDFHLNPKSNMSAHRYKREFIECQNLGLV